MLGFEEAKGIIGNVLDGGKAEKEKKIQEDRKLEEQRKKEKKKEEERKDQERRQQEELAAKKLEEQKLNERKKIEEEKRKIEENNKIELEKKKIEQQKLEAEKLKIEKERNQIEEERKKLQQQRLELQNIKTEEKKPVKVEDEFLTILQNFCLEKKIMIDSFEVIRKKSEIDMILKIPSVVGDLDYYCKAKNKKKLTDSDLSAAFVQGQLKKLPVIVFTPGDLTKKAEELLKTELNKGLIVKKI